MTAALPPRHSREVLSLLDKLVDRLDSAEARGSGSAQTVALNGTTWPALFHAALESDKELFWEQLLNLARAGWVEVTPAAAFRSACGYDMQPRLRVLNGQAVRLAVGRKERLKSAPERWRDAVYEHLAAPDEVKKAASEYCIDIPDRSMAEVVARLNQLKALSASPQLLREVSSRLFWGMSKVLDNRTGLVTAILQVEECPFPASPLQLQVHLPCGALKGVLFIENQMTFELASRSENTSFSGLALIFASGFKGSAARLRNQHSASLYFSYRGALSDEATHYFSSWLFSKTVELPAWFWGDLDWSGMRILAAMKTNFPGMLAWEPGYRPMLESLVAGNGHSPESADKAGQRPLSTTGCSYADSQLISALNCHGKFVDQEQFSL